MFKSQKNRFALLLSMSLFCVAVAGAKAAPPTYDFKDPKEISAVSLTLVSNLEPIFGYAKGISGTINFDPTHSELTTGSIAVEVSNVQFANERYTQTAQGVRSGRKKNSRRSLSPLKNLTRQKNILLMRLFQTQTALKN